MKWIFCLLAIMAVASSMLVHAENCKNENGNTCARYGQYGRYCNKVTVGENAATYACLDKEDKVISETLSSHGSNQLSGKCVVDASTGKGSYNIGNRCRELVATGCDASTAYNGGGGTGSCSNLATRTNVDGKNLCVAKENLVSGIEVNGLCGNGTAFNCGPNAVCNSLRICEPASKIGEHCGGTYGGCVTGSTCFNRYCTAPHSIDNGQACNANELCKSNWCNTKVGLCQAPVVKRCFFNHECPTGSSCVDATESQQGRCAMHVGRTYDYLNCIASKCYHPYGSSDYDKDCASKNCMYELTRASCQTACVKPTDQQFTLDIEHSFDCAESKATAWADLDAKDRCGLSNQFQNCDKADYLWDN